MRISSTLFFQTGLNSINAQQTDLMHLFQQVGSGQRMVTPADDPLAAAQAINISQSQSLNKRFAENREVARRNLGIEENTLTSVTLLMQDVKTRLVEAGNGTMSDADRATLANVLSNTKSTLLGLANSTDVGGQYLFSGSQGGMAAFATDALGAVSWQGDSLARNIQVDQTRQLDGGDSGADVFLRASPGVNGYLTTAVTSNGTARISTPTITDPAGANVGKDFDITFTSATTYEVVVTDRTVAAPVPDPAVAYTYDPGATSLALPGGVQIKFSGDPVAGDVFSVNSIASPAAGLNIFDTLDSVIAALKSPANGDSVAQAALGNALAGAMQRLDVHYDNVLTVRASVGARLNEIDALDARGIMRDLGYTMQLSRLEDLDYYTATTSLQLRQSALEAAALAFRKIQDTSLFNMGNR